MLTPKQYEAIGEMALSFNDLEFSLEVYIAHLLKTPEWSVAIMLSEEGMFRHKAERFKKILRAISRDRPAIQPQIEPVIDVLKKANKLADKRNGYVHAMVVQNFETKEVRLRTRRPAVEMVCNEEEINKLTEEAVALGFELHDKCGELFMPIWEMRESESL